MKKLFLLLFICTALFMLPACGSSVGEQENNPSQQTDTETADNDEEEGNRSEDENEVGRNEDEGTAGSSEKEEGGRSDDQKAENLGSEVSDPFSGEYYDECDEPLIIKRNSDGTYAISFSVYRIASIDNAVGVATSQGLEFSTDEYGVTFKGIITMNYDTAILTFTDGWSEYSSTDTYEYHSAF